MQALVLLLGILTLSQVPNLHQIGWADDSIFSNPAVWLKIFETSQYHAHVLHCFDSDGGELERAGMAIPAHFPGSGFWMTPATIRDPRLLSSPSLYFARVVSS